VVARSDTLFKTPLRNYVKYRRLFLLRGRVGRRKKWILILLPSLLSDEIRKIGCELDFSVRGVKSEGASYLVRLYSCGSCSW
jgi:hypothetical protein